MYFLFLVNGLQDIRTLKYGYFQTRFLEHRIYINEWHGNISCVNFTWMQCYTNQNDKEIIMSKIGILHPGKWEFQLPHLP